MFKLERHGQVEILSMQYGPANAMDLTFCTELTSSVQKIMASTSGAIVLTGQGKIFCAGVDLPQLLEGGVDYVRQFLPALDELFETLFFCHKPIIAAVNGHAIAGGCLLTCCADQRIMANTKARIGVPELRVGVPFPTTAMEIMRAKTNPDFYEEVTIGGGTYTPQAALKRGLIDAVEEPEELIDKALDAAKSLLAIRPQLYAFSKQQSRQPVREAIDKRTILQEEALYKLWESEESLAAVKDFVSRTLKKY